jgi:cation:H+ antiporter
VSNAVGGIAAQTAFLALADMAHRRANLEHAAASIENLLQGALLVVLLALPLLALSAPELVVWGVNPASILLVATYVLGIRLAAKARAQPLWTPARTAETRHRRVRDPVRRRMRACHGAGCR